MLEKRHADTLEMIQGLYDLFVHRNEAFEVIVINNGADTRLAQELTPIFQDRSRFKYFDLFTRTTEAVCLKVGLKESCGNIIIVYGSYQQITNSALIEILESMDDDVDIVSLWRQHRKDNWFNQIQSKVYNQLINAVTKSNIHDLGCKVKVFRREVIEQVDIYGDMYQYISILADTKGFKTKEIKCDHFKDHGKAGLYGVSMYFNRLLEILTLCFNTRFTRKPLRFFSFIGFIFFFIGLIISSFVVIQKMIFNYPIGSRPALLLSIFFIVLGAQAASVGLLGEIIAFTHGRHKKEYTIEKII